MYRINLRDFVLCSGILLLGGCTSIGPDSVKKVHFRYNDAITKTSNEQLVVNLVRGRYRDSFNFVEITNILNASKSTMRVGVGPNGTKFGFDKNKGHIDFGPFGHGEVFDNPTVTYVPLRGDQYAQRMTSPIPIVTILGLIEGGWNLKRVFNLCVERINHLDNASTASGPTPTKKPDYEQFAEAVELIETLHKQNHLIMGIKNREVMVFKFTNSDSQSQKLKSFLGIDPNSSEFYFSSNFLDADANLTIRTRSAMEVLFYLSHAVYVPKRDIDAGLVTVTKDDDGKVFDWHKNLTGEWINIYCSEGKERPQNAYVSIFYRGAWFYIRDNDLNSKSTFMLFNHLLNLQSGKLAQFAPMLAVSTN
ncbi:MAG: hypothetical protein LBJ13_03100 [Puniceicoccales bacterium]|jgi:hypothetical protein|nr:hypothetical protein [Puniceicoccales bacterium]